MIDDFGVGGGAIIYYEREDCNNILREERIASEWCCEWCFEWCCISID